MTAAAPALHQALHGYQEGHRLLAASTAIEADDARQMLVLSDSPDADMIGPEQPLLCGYPLPSGRFYVWALTWPALELRRPGCVWTHSLLLDEGALEQPDLSGILSLFSRPEAEPKSWRRYEGPLPPKKAAGGLAFSPPPVTATALWSLYEPPAPPLDLRVQALAGVDSHRFLLAVWHQQWPQLRRHFSFAEAPRTARRIGEQLIDLQLTTSPQRGSWEPTSDRQKPRTITKPLQRRPPAWSLALFEDLAKPGPLREYLRDWESIAPAERESVYVLTSWWAGLQASRPDLTGLIDGLTRAFPGEEALELKRELTGPEPSTLLPQKPDQVALLLSLADREDGEASLAIPDLDVGARAELLIKKDPEAALELAGKLISSPAGSRHHALLSAIAAALAPPQLSQLVASEPRIAAELILASPQLAADPELWSSEMATELWPLLGKPKHARAKRKSMLAGILAADSEEFFEAALEHWKDAAEITLELIAEGHPLSDPGLLEAIPDQQIVAWLKKNGPAPKLTKILVDNWKPKRIGKVPVAELDALQESGQELSDFTLVRLFLAASDPEGGFSVARAISIYQDLQRRIGEGPLKKKAFKALTGSADGALSAAEQAGQRLATAFIDHDWPSSALLGISDAGAFAAVLDNPESVPLLGALLPLVERSAASPEQGRVVWDALSEANDVSLLQKSLKFARKHVPWSGYLLGG